MDSQLFACRWALGNCKMVPAVFSGSFMPTSLICPICERTKVEPFLHRAQVPANQNLVVASVDEAQNIPRGELTLCKCLSCGFVFNCTFDVSLLHYGSSYDNTQSRSSSFLQHLDAMVEDIVVRQGMWKR